MSARPFPSFFVILLRACGDFFCFSRDTTFPPMVFWRLAWLDCYAARVYLILFAHDLFCRGRRRDVYRSGFGDSCQAMVEDGWMAPWDA
ncbi:hypothetical protein BDZ45DRAFT_493843 [Acephala macrosclerotiorum]|nr:hypothetical protein BDZ45DRAFT_493843 [Acephala macrosclerotiorum]